MFRCATLWLAALLCGALPAQAALFGMADVRRSGGASAFTKWQDMLHRPDSSSSPRGMPDSGGCVPNPRFACPPRPDSRQLVDSLRGDARLQQLRRVNSTMNGVRYIVDPVNWGVEDYWATLAQFLRRDGDCEDYAIAKYMLLKQAGVPVTDMRIAIVMDLNLNIPHAILAVRDGTSTYILDNQIQDVLPDTSIRHYKPYYAINEEAWWVYLPR